MQLKFNNSKTPNLFKISDLNKSRLAHKDTRLASFRTGNFEKFVVLKLETFHKWSK